MNNAKSRIAGKNVGIFLYLFLEQKQWEKWEIKKQFPKRKLFDAYE